MTGNTADIFLWWFVFFIFGIISLPLVQIFFKKFFDLGYGFSKTIGTLIIAYTAFILAIFKIIPLTPAIYLSLIFYVGLNLSIFQKNKNQIIDGLKQKYKIIIFQEILFTAGFVIWSYVRAHQPDIDGLEKFMDFGFINSILRSKYLPPADMWFAGLPINYYWFGHFWVAVVTKVSNIPSSITYNLMLATILGLSLSSAFSIVSTLTSLIKKGVNKRSIFLAGLISAIILNFAGNFHTPFYVLKNGKEKYWYPDATRFIGYNPETNDKTIHEFPMYSYVVSDLHAHLINLPFVLLFIALLLNYIQKGLDKDTDRKAGKRIWKLPFQLPKSISKLVSIPKPTYLLPLGFLLGVFFMTSTWDFGNYSLLTGICFLIFYLNKNSINIKNLLKVGVRILIIVSFAVLTALPFLIHFESIAQGIDFVHTHSPFWQLAILWGFPAILTIIYAPLIYKNNSEIIISDIFVLSLLTTSWLLILLPEIVYVKDIYIASHYRANTMFKLTYQAFVMSYLSSGYILARSFSLIKRGSAKILLAFIFAFSICAILIYPKFAIKSYYNDLKIYKGLSGETWVKNRYPDIYNTILWFRKNVQGQPTILEAPGDSYTEFNMISSYTGLPTVSGWFVHEWLWRGDSSFPQKRVSDISVIYTSDNIALTKNLLNKYKVKYVIIGDFERQKFPNINEGKFEQLGRVVFRSETTKIIYIN